MHNLIRAEQSTALFPTAEIKCIFVDGKNMADPNQGRQNFVNSVAV